MPITIQIVRELDLVISRATGELTTEELLRHHKDLAGHVHFDPRLRHLGDVREAVVAPDYDALRRVAHSDPFHGEARRALLVPDDLHFALGRQYAAHIQAEKSEGFRPVRTLAEAAAWLQIAEDELAAALEGGAAAE